MPGLPVHHQGRHRDRYDDRGGREAAEPLIDILPLQHLIHAHGHCEIILVRAAQDLRQHKILEGACEGVEQRKHDDGLAQRHDDLFEHVPLGAAVQHGRLIQRDGDGVEEALGDVVAKARAAGIHRDHSQPQQRPVGPP